MGDQTSSENIKVLNHIYPHITAIDGKTTDEEIKTIYDKWASTYDKDMESKGYVADDQSVKRFSEILENHILGKDANILDVGAGTGKGGLQLHKLGYSNVDALDICSKMLEIAEQKKVYKKLICAGLEPENATGIADNTYDAQISIGCITVGHAKPDALKEMARIAKPGGLISFTLRTFVWEDNAYGYNKVINSLVEKGVWDIVSADKIDFNLSDHVGDEDTSLRYYYLITCQKKK